MVFQNDVNLRYNGFGALTDGTSSAYVGTAQSTAVPNLAGDEDAEDSGAEGCQLPHRAALEAHGLRPDTPLNSDPEPGGDPDTRTPTRDYDFTNVLSNSQVGGSTP